LEIQVAIDELEIAQIKIGQASIVTFEALPGQKYDAEVTYINPLGRSVNNVTSYFVTITLEETTDILIGMSGTADIQSDLKQGIITIPLEALQIIDDEYYVILGADAATKTVADHKVTVGVSDGTNIEILEGLSVGDTITVPVENQGAVMTGFGGGMSGGTQ
jgi:multidrug efflux pump subunit AcrA (membrane-fusion protein)